MPTVFVPSAFELYICEKGRIAHKEYWITQEQISFSDSTFQKEDTQRNQQISINEEEAFLILDSLNKLEEIALAFPYEQGNNSKTETSSFTFTWSLNGKLHSATIQNEKHPAFLELVATINKLKEIPRINYDEAYFESFS